MPKISGWSRRESLETENKPFVWEHDKHNAYMEVVDSKKHTGRPGSYYTILATDQRDYELYSSPTQGVAKRKAIGYMRAKSDKDIYKKTKMTTSLE